MKCFDYEVCAEGWNAVCCDPHVPSEDRLVVGSADDLQVGLALVQVLDHPRGHVVHAPARLDRHGTARKNRMI